ncbi:MAG: DHHA1 domain-containing protein [Pseudomonadota bacterium]|nr:DHHA1 domain-containing protein [Pseudomonadota bacterium]
MVEKVVEKVVGPVETGLLDRVRQSTAVLLTGPEGPDGDSIGACLALQRLLSVAAPGVRVDVAGSPGHRYGWLPGAAAMVPDSRVGAYDGVVVLDGDKTRLCPDVERAFAGARWTGIVDHHRSTDLGGYDVALFDPAAESTCGMVSALAKGWGVPLDADLATLLYVGIIFDTGGFRYSNTAASTHRLAADLLETGIDHAHIMLKVLVERRPAALRLMARLLQEAIFLAKGRLAMTTCTLAMMREIGANGGDLEGVVDMLQHTEGVDLAVVVVERGPDRVKLSLRSSGRVDVAALARSLDPGGGGHAKAAGATLLTPVSEVIQRLSSTLVPMLDALP